MRTGTARLTRLIDLSCSNQLMISNQNTHAFRPNFLVAPFTTQWRLPWADFLIFHMDTFASLSSSLFVKVANIRRSGAVVDSCFKQRRGGHNQGAYGGLERASLPCRTVHPKKMTRKRDSSHVHFIKICFHKYANLHMTEESQHRIPHVMFVISIGIRRGEQGRACERGRGV